VIHDNDHEMKTKMSATDKSCLRPSSCQWLTSIGPGIVSSGNAWERRSQSYFRSGNGVPRNAVVR